MKKNCSASGGKRPNLGVVRGQSTRNTPKFGISTPLPEQVQKIYQTWHVLCYPGQKTLQK
jgi:hypothetical protein